MHLTTPSPAAESSRKRGARQSFGKCCGFLSLLGLAIAPSGAWATCGFASGSATTVTFDAGTITLTPNTEINTVLWTSGTATPADPPVLACNGNTNGGIVNTITADSTPVNGDNTLIPTGIPGISYRLLHPDESSALALYPNNATDTGTFNIASKLQLVYTGPYLPPNNSTLTGQLSQWKIDICDRPNIGSIFGYVFYRDCKRNGSIAPRPVEIFNIYATILIQVPTCNVSAGSLNKTVNLPSVTTLQFSGTPPTAGTTPFNLQLTNCPANLGVFIKLNADNHQTNATGVIAPSGPGYASGVGVQILKADGTTPVTFGTYFETGVTSASNYTISLFARYYQTETAISAGTVKGIATYTLNYQ